MASISSCASFVSEPTYKLCSPNIDLARIPRGDGKSFTHGGSDTIVWASTDGKCCHRPLNITFRCTRHAPHVDASIKKIYDTIVADKSDTLLVSNPYGCPANKNTGHCGNVRGHLAECKCKILNRKDDPNARKVYEDSIIKEIMTLIGSTLINFNIRIAMFASGQLHGEDTLLMKLFKALRDANSNCKGKIHVSLIDTDYKDSIAISHSINHLPKCTSFPWKQFLGNRPDFEQFVTEMSLCLPQNVVLEGSFFASSDDYILKAQKFGHKHDIMIGADLDGLDPLMEKTNLAASRTFLPSVALVKRQEGFTYVSKVCHFQNTIENCVTTS